MKITLKSDNLKVIFYLFDDFSKFDYNEFLLTFYFYDKSL